MIKWATLVGWSLAAGPSFTEIKIPLPLCYVLCCKAALGVMAQDWNNSQLHRRAVEKASLELTLSQFCTGKYRRNTNAILDFRLVPTLTPSFTQA
jgi:hypothetical protein